MNFLISLRLNALLHYTFCTIGFRLYAHYMCQNGIRNLTAKAIRALSHMKLEVANERLLAHVQLIMCVCAVCMYTCAPSNVVTVLQA